jgi:hypothetical protein
VALPEVGLVDGEEFQVAATRAAVRRYPPVSAACSPRAAEQPAFQVSGDPTCVSSGPLSGVLDEARFQTHAITLGAPHIVHRRSLTVVAQT